MYYTLCIPFVRVSKYHKMKRNMPESEIYRQDQLNGIRGPASINFVSEFLFFFFFWVGWLCVCIKFSLTTANNNKDEKRKNGHKGHWNQSVGDGMKAEHWAKFWKKKMWWTNRSEEMERDTVLINALMSFFGTNTAMQRTCTIRCRWWSNNHAHWMHRNLFFGTWK